MRTTADGNDAPDTSGPVSVRNGGREQQHATEVRA